MDVPRVASKLSSVTVFRSGALVTRRVALARGGDGVFPDTVRVGNLPLTMVDGSVRVRVEPRGEGPAPVASDVRVTLEVADQDAKLPPPTNEALEAAESTVEGLEAEVAGVERSRDRLQRLEIDERPEGDKDVPPPETPLDARLALAAMRTKELERLQGRLVELERQLKEARETAADLRARHELATTARQARENELRKTAVVGLRSLDGGCTGDAELVIEYQVPGARWAPAYAVRFDEEYRHGAVAMRAVVAQRTGEDWDDVDLTLSTADPHMFAELPELKSLRVGRRQPEPARAGWRPPPTGTDELYGDYDRAFPGEDAVTGAPLSDVKPRPKPRTKDEARRMMKAKRAEREAMKQKDKADDCTTGYAMPEAEEAELCVRDMAPPGGAYGGAPPAPPLMEPMPCAEPAMARRSSSLVGAAAGGLLDALEGAVSRSRAAAPTTNAGIIQPDVLADFLGRGGGGPADGPAVPLELEAPIDLLDYGRMRLAAPGVDERGKLRPTSQAALYMELLTNLQVQVSFDVTAVVARAVAEAAAVGSAALPPSHVAPEAVDNFSYVFGAEARVDVPSDGQFHSLPLFSREVPVSLQYVVVPRQTSDAFRMVSFANDAKTPLLAGPADVTVGDRYLVTTRLATTPPGGTVELGLGVEQRIKVARNTHFGERQEGLITSELCLSHDIEVELANNMACPAAVDVRERIPYVPDDEKDVITVELGEVEPPWKSFEQKSGGLMRGFRWNVTVPAGEKQKLKAHYEIHMPAKYELVGGNRREA